MATAVTHTAVCKNRILTGLPREQYHPLFSNLTPVNLHHHQVLYDAGDDIRYAYFINDGMASSMCITTEGSSIEVGNVGNEGMVGIPVLLRHVTSPHQVVVLVPGEALAVTTDILKREFNKEGELKNRLLSYTQALVTYMSQLGVCNHFHTVDKRLCRWLLLSRLQIQSQSFHLTHDALSQVLGTGRTGVTMAANKLQKAGLIQYHRGQITILNRAGLEAACCDCYKITKEVFDYSLGS
jgi:cAMP-binding proteins - catabolite gene activator and regulatory subunit of cAMP-dependent protein kinases